MKDKPTPLDMGQVSRANFDLAERLFNEGVHLVYDEDGDTLLMTIGEGKPAIATPVLDGIYFRIEPETYKILGFTIIAFASDLLANNKLVRKLFPNAPEAFEKSGGVIEWKGQQAQRIKPVFEFALSR